MPLLTEPQWKTLKRLYGAGKTGIAFDGSSYSEAGPWPVIIQLRDHNPPLAREVTRLDPQNQTVHYLVVITDAGDQFYEANRKLHELFYPSI
jgi:hypothetical protein